MRAYISTVVGSYVASRYYKARLDRARIKTEVGEAGKLKAAIKNKNKTLKLLRSKPLENERKRGKPFQLDDGALMTVLTFADLPSAIALMGSSKQVRDALRGKLKKRFWEMTFWRDRGVLLYLNQFSLFGRGLELPVNVDKWEWSDYMRAYYSTNTAFVDSRFLIFGRCTSSRIQQLRQLDRKRSEETRVRRSSARNGAELKAMDDNICQADV
mmetsp:Transcript_17778/g.26636  ORF Transcript_17778/g.26636 Transcript_17778/m.26636 type:complete len:213 (-) Transcript_17778:155-793(-)